MNLFTLPLARMGILWLLIRLLLSMLVAFASGNIRPTFHFGMQVTPLVIAGAILDVRRRGDRLLFANLGVSSIEIGTLAAPVTIVAELVLAFFVKLVGL